MELRALHYFVTVAEELHFGRAAERLRIVQPAVSQQVARLERELGARLLDRTSRRVRLTPAGERVLVAAREALAAAARVRVVAGERGAVVRIGLASCVDARVDRALGRLGDVEPELVDLPVSARLAAVRAGELDVALVRGAVPSGGEVRVARAWTERLHAVVSHEHPAAGASSVRLADLSPEGLRLPAREVDPPLHDAILAALPTAPRRPPSGDLMNALYEVARDPAGWALLPEGQVANVRPGRVVPVPLDPPLEVDGHVVASAVTPASCLASYAAAFGD
ncbi:LysR family transcriptional regulator [Actinosynnema pretiosum]|uniref:LysR family transcriptional regulator n=1 Tax=Actinosynnema pretiosum TaxID=42197 RepID=A0A290ZDN2_9PSEU|nr:LysR family transcriptional regulator [Actinosynnema pretiosum]ATE57107.1 LysR family transcriptional regulator [Actinosynnema pretiosum]